MEIYPWSYIFQKQKTVLLWVTYPENDHFLTTKKGKLISASSIQKLKTKVKKKKYNVQWDEPGDINFDKFWTAINNLRENRASSIKTCKVLLDGWNFIEDMGRTFSLQKEMKRLKSKILNKAYQKIFAGNNLPGVTPEGMSYSPLWTKKEIKALKKEFRYIWKLFLTNKYITHK